MIKKAEAECVNSLNKEIITNYDKCSAICESQKPQCSTKYTSEIKVECETECEYKSWGPLSAWCGIPNIIECTSKGSAETECNCENFVKWN